VIPFNSRLRRVVKFLLVVPVGLLPAGPASAIKLFNSSKVKRPYGVAVSLRVEMVTVDHPWVRQNLYFYPAPGTNHTVATLARDATIRVTGVLNGHTGHHARHSDKIRMTLFIWTPGAKYWRVLATQEPAEQRNLRPEERWSGILSVEIPSHELPLGPIYIKVDADIPGDPPQAILNKVDFTIEEMMGMSAGIMPSPWTSSSSDPKPQATPVAPASAGGLTAPERKADVGTATAP
jgi:hypothetical protein